MNNKNGDVDKGPPVPYKDENKALEDNEYQAIDVACGPYCTFVIGR
jgi:hypothetical protein